MVLINTENLIGAALDWAVAIAEGATPGVNLVICLPNPPQHVVRAFNLGHGPSKSYNPSADWAQAGPIIEREWICVGRDAGDAQWVSYILKNDPSKLSFGPTPLIAALRCYLASKLGPNVEVPEELAQ